MRPGSRLLPSPSGEVNPLAVDAEDSLGRAPARLMPWRSFRGKRHKHFQSRDARLVVQSAATPEPTPGIPGYRRVQDETGVHRHLIAVSKRTS